MKPADQLSISIHVLREEDDTSIRASACMRYISIHVLREEDDASSVPVLMKLANFYPRPPRGGRPPMLRNHLSSLVNFYPRPPRGGRHVVHAVFVQLIGISIHVLREEDDRRSRKTSCLHQHFYPRPPRGGRLDRDCIRRNRDRFLSTSSARRTTVSQGLILILT